MDPFADKFRGYEYIVGLALLVAIIMMAEIASTGLDRLTSKIKPDFQTDGDCLYRVLLNGNEVGILFSQGSRSLRSVLDTLGADLKHQPENPDQSVECNRTILLEDFAKSLTLEKIPGHVWVNIGKPMDLNLADEDDLKAIPGVGPVLGAGNNLQETRVRMFSARGGI